MEQLVARRAHNPKVVGSSPAPATLTGQFRFSKLPGFFSYKFLFIQYSFKLIRKL